MLAELSPALQDSDTDSEPPSLLQQCYQYVTGNLAQTICCKTDSGFELNNGVVLPKEICDRLLASYQRQRRSIDDDFASVFRNDQVTKLTRVHVKNSGITDEGLAILLKHKLESLTLRKCCFITMKTLQTINEYGANLVSLTIGDGVPLFPDLPTNEESMQEEWLHLNTPNLRSLSIHNLRKSRESIYLSYLLKPLTQLVHLDLSGCLNVGELASVMESNSLHNLKSLVLHDVPDLVDRKNCILLGITKLKNLEFLDISQLGEAHGKFSSPDETLAMIVLSLPKLRWLDISGTNLAGTGVADVNSKNIASIITHGCDNDSVFENKTQKSDIIGLISRVNNPLEFLGLFGAHHEACFRHDIPAKLISGDATENQIITAALRYLDRPAVILQVLNDLYHRFRCETVHNVVEVLSIILTVLDRHIMEKKIQISGSATFFYIVKNQDKLNLPTRLKRRMVTSLLNSMHLHTDIETIIRNGCLTLSQFKIPSEVLFEYRRLVKVLLVIVAKRDVESFVRRVSIHLLNSLACQVSRECKELLGNLGAINVMIEIIQEKLLNIEADDVLDIAWSTMWNVTDETPINCMKFLNKKGMSYFIRCVKQFPDKGDLMRNMMGLLGNVAEVESLRPRLMVHSYISVFSHLLSSSCDGIEVSYNATGVLCHLASDGEDAWTIQTPRRDEVLMHIQATVDTWDLNLNRNINYRSFAPILKLAQVFHTPQCQHWAIWALANLTKVYPEKYCSLIEEENGFEILQKVIDYNGAQMYPRIKELAELVFAHCRNYHSYRSKDEAEQIDFEG